MATRELQKRIFQNKLDKGWNVTSVEKPASGNKGAFPSPLIQYLTFLLLKEVEPNWDTFLVEQMSSFYERFSWAYEKQNPNDIMAAAIQDVREYTARSTGMRNSEEVEFFRAYNWKKLDANFKNRDDTNPLVPYFDLTIGDSTRRICLRNAHIQDGLARSDASEVYIAAVNRGRSYDGLLVITKHVYDSFGDEVDNIRYELASEMLKSPSCVQDILLHPEYQNEIARTLAYLSTLPNVGDGLTDAAIAEACRKVNRQRICQIAADAVPELLELLGFLSPPCNAVRSMTEAFLMHRLLFAAFGACLGLSYWAIDEKKNCYDAITENFSYQVARDHLSLLTGAETAEKLLEPLLLVAENHPEELDTRSRELLFDYMVQALGWENKEFALRIAAALFAQELTKYEADYYFIEADPDEQSDELMDLIRTGFRSSVRSPIYYYPYALQVICSDEPAFAISFGEDLARSEQQDLKVLGFSILGTLGKAALENWDLPCIKGDTITDESVVCELFRLAATSHPAQTFYQKMLSNLVCAGYIRSASICPPNPAYPKQYRDLWLAEGIRDAVGFYPREFYCLDNFSPFAVRYDGELYATAEAAYQGQKFYYTHPEIEEQIRFATSPHDAKRIADEHRELCRPDWDELKQLIMEDILRGKLSQHAYVRKKLLETGDMPIVEDSPYDYFWGIGFDRTGENHLGKIWMKLRAELRAES